MRQSESRVAALLVPPLRRLALLDDASPCLLTSALNIVTDPAALSPAEPSPLPCCALASVLVGCDRLGERQGGRVLSSCYHARGRLGGK